MQVDITDQDIALIQHLHELAVGATPVGQRIQLSMQSIMLLQKITQAKQVEGQALQANGQSPQRIKMPARPGPVAELEAEKDSIQ